MSRLYYGYLVSTRKDRKDDFKNGIIKDERETWFAGLEVGDYALIQNTPERETIISLCKVIAKERLDRGVSFKFDVIKNDIGIKSKQLRNLKGLRLNSSLVKMERRSSNGFFEVKLEDGFDLNTIIQDNYYSNLSNYRKIQLLTNENQIVTNAEDIQLYLKDGELKLFEASFFDKETFSCFSDKRCFRNGSHQNKDKIYEKIDGWLASNERKELSYNELSFSQLYDAFFCEYKDKTEDEILVEETESQEKDMKNTLVGDLSNLLTQTHNLILHGAPGTGKTYLANEIAKSMNAEVGFVQFHPSYDYTDFVEGLRPVRGENAKEIGFELRDGVFKNFCIRALQSKSSGGVDNYYEVIKKFAEKLEEDGNKGVDIPLLSGKGNFRIALNSNGDGFVTLSEQENGTYQKDSGRFYNFEQCYRVYRGLPGVPKGGLDNYRKAIIDYLKKNYGLKDYVTGTIVDMQVDKTVADNQNKPFVFIIDEINRGDMSKILGELFFAIEPSYRGEEKCKSLRTQYANLQEEPNAFDEVLGIKDEKDYGHFFIPENVYIIGTMNDIDRSVESMDFAMRRRFTFYEIKAKDNISMLDALGDKKDEAKFKMNQLNEAIDEIPELNSSYHIGGAYFLKLEDLNYDFDQLWDYHLEPLLKEYLRGTEDPVGSLDKLRNAYKKTINQNTESESNASEEINKSDEK